jgi:predicted RNase H-like nuclease (RuvC/YqgF family)
MASATKKSMCSECAPKQVVAVTSCHGCSKSFCRKHFNEHREQLSKDINSVFDQHDHFLQEFQLKSGDASKPLDTPSARALLKQIDEWKIKTIESVSQAADNAREHVERLFSKKQVNDKLKQRIDSITKELKEKQESEIFVETDINQWMKQLKILENDLNRPSAVETNPPVLQIQNVDWKTIIKVCSPAEIRGRSVNSARSQANESMCHIYFI